MHRPRKWNQENKKYTHFLEKGKQKNRRGRVFGTRTIRDDRSRQTVVPGDAVRLFAPQPNPRPNRPSSFAGGKKLGPSRMRGTAPSIKGTREENPWS